MKNILAVALVVAVASIALSQDPNIPAEFRAPELAVPAGAAPAAVRQPQRWEYKVSDRGGFNPDAWDKRLNDMAKDGWELDQIDQGEGHYIFRRPALRVGVDGGGFF